MSVGKKRRSSQRVTEHKRVFLSYAIAWDPKSQQQKPSMTVTAGDTEDTQVEVEAGCHTGMNRYKFRGLY